MNNKPMGNTFVKPEDLNEYAKVKTLKEYIKASELANYAMKTEIPSLTGYAKSSDLDKYPLASTLGNYVKKTDLQAGGVFDLTKLSTPASTASVDLSGYAKTSALESLRTTLGNYAKTSDLGGYVKQESLKSGGTYDISGFAAKAQLNDYLPNYTFTETMKEYPKSTAFQANGAFDLTKYSTSAALESLRTTLGNYAKTDGVPVLIENKFFKNTSNKQLEFIDTKDAYLGSARIPTLIIGDYPAATEIREANAGKILYKAFDTKDALDVVGAGPASGSRKVKIWDNLDVSGNLKVNGNIDGYTKTSETPALIENNFFKNSSNKQLDYAYINSAINNTLRVNDKMYIGSTATTRPLDAGVVSYNNSALNIYGGGTIGSSKQVKIYDNLDISGNLRVNGNIVGYTKQTDFDYAKQGFLGPYQLKTQGGKCAEKDLTTRKLKEGVCLSTNTNQQFLYNPVTHQIKSVVDGQCYRIPIRNDTNTLNWSSCSASDNTQMFFKSDKDYYHTFSPVGISETSGVNNCVDIANATNNYSACSNGYNQQKFRFNVI